MIDIYPNFQGDYWEIDRKCRFYPREKGSIRSAQYDYKYSRMRDKSTIYRKRFINIESGIWEYRR